MSCDSCKDRFTLGLPGTTSYVNGRIVRSWYPHDCPPNTNIVQFFVEDDVRGMLKITFTQSWQVEPVPESKQAEEAAP
jgi:hypothetical protein